MTYIKTGIMTRIMSAGAALKWGGGSFYIPSLSRRFPSDPVDAV